MRKERIEHRFSEQVVSNKKGIKEKKQKKIKRKILSFYDIL